MTGKTKGKLSLCLAAFIIVANIMCMSANVFAESDSLNEIGSSKTTVQTESTTGTSTSAQGTSSQTQTSSSSNTSTSNSDAATAVTEVFKQGALTQESVDKAAKWVQPVAKVINVAMAIILGIFSAILVLISVIDLVYIGVPAIRPYLMPGGGQQPQGGGSPMMGGGGYGGGQMGYGGGHMGYGGGQMGYGGGSPMMNGGQQPQGAGATIGQWISDDAKQAVAEAQAQAGGGGSPMGMMPGGGQQAAPVQGKNLVVAYLKKRAFTLIMLGVCLVLLTCTIFTDLGTMLGMKILALLSGINF